MLSHVVQMGGARATAARPTFADLAQVDESPVRCFDPAAAEAMILEVKAAAKDGDSLGGVVEILAEGVPVGLGSHVHWDRKLDAMLAAAVMSIQAVKGVEIGDGFEVAGRRGARPMTRSAGTTKTVATAAIRPWPAASREACRRASCSSCGRR